MREVEVQCESERVSESVRVSVCCVRERVSESGECLFYVRGVNFEKTQIEIES